MSITAHIDLEAPMRDGTVLRADAYHPSADGKYPVLLCRTPYDKSAEKQTEIGPKLAARGYLVVMQDVRGRYASDGDFRPGFYSAENDDAEDGYDSVEWTALLPWSNGRVGTFGNSYDGWLQWELAPTRPPHLVAMLASGITANLLDRELSGVLRLGRVLEWTMNNLSVDTARRLDHPYKTRDMDESSRRFVEQDRNKWLWYLPLMDIPDESMPGMGSHWRRWLADHATDHFRFQQKASEVAVPVLDTAAAGGTGGSHRADRDEAVGVLIGAGHRLRRQIAGCLVRWLRAGVVPWNRSSAVSPLLRRAFSARTGRHLRVHDSRQPDQQSVPARPPDPTGRNQQRLSQL